MVKFGFFFFFLQVTGDFNKMLALQNLLEPYGICEVRLQIKITI